MEESLEDFGLAEYPFGLGSDFHGEPFEDPPGSKEEDDYKEDEGATIQSIELALLSAAQNNNRDKIQQIREAIGESFSKALIHACRADSDLETIKLLLDQGAKVGFQDDKGISSLMEAAEMSLDRHADPQIVDLLLQRCDNLCEEINRKDADGWTALHYACGIGFIPSDIARVEDQKAVVESLVRAGADMYVCSGDEDVGNPFQFACKNCNFAVVKQLWELAVDKDIIHLTTGSGKTPLMFAATCLLGIEDTVKWLVDKGAKIEAKDNNGDTALRHGIIAYSEAPVLALISAGADISGTNAVCSQSGFTPLHHATSECWGAFNDCVGRLIHAGIEVDARDKEGLTALHYACRYGNFRENTEIEVVEKLLKAGADVDGPGEDGLSTLASCSWNGKADVVEILLSAAQTNVNFQDNDGVTAIHAACDYVSKEHLKVSQALVDAGADVNIQDNHGFTALHRACESQKYFRRPWWQRRQPNEDEETIKELRLKLVKVLLKAGARTDLMTYKGIPYQGSTPLVFAAAKGHSEIVRLLVERSVEEFCVVSRGVAPPPTAQDPVEAVFEDGGGNSNGTNLDMGKEDACCGPPPKRQRRE